MNWGERAVQGMSAGFGNVGFMGLPILVTLFGDAAVLPAVLIIVFDHVLLIPLTTALIEGSNGGNASLPAIFKRVAIGMSRNPLIISTFAGLLWGLTGLDLLTPIETLLNLLANASAPCALFAWASRWSDDPFQRVWSRCRSPPSASWRFIRSWSGCWQPMS